MVAWQWLILAFVVGGNVGLFIMAAIACGRESDRMMEARYEDRKGREEMNELEELKEIKKAVELNYCFTTGNWAGKQVRNPQEDERWLIAEIERLWKELPTLMSTKDCIESNKSLEKINDSLCLRAEKSEARVKELEKGLMKKLVDNAKRARIILEKKLGG